jgi:hypothetical protein
MEQLEGHREYWGAQYPDENTLENICSDGAGRFCI